jgi:hypothetical protein
MSNDKSMSPMTGDVVDTDGVYENEAGREVTLNRGDIFPSDLMLGRTTWELKSFLMNDSRTLS